MDRSNINRNSISDVVAGLLFIAVAVGFVVQSQRIEVQDAIMSDVLGPSGVPTALGVIMGIIGALLALRGLNGIRTGSALPIDIPGETPGGALPVASENPHPDRTESAGQGIGGVVRAGSAIVLCIVYAAVLPIVGFAIATPIFIPTLTWIITGRDRVVRVTIFTAALTVSVYIVFLRFVGLSIPLLP